jgi:exonuclease SbcC
VRPVRLEIEGFGPYRNRVEVDLTDADLFALVGPTGAGKSAIIDALTFALYGSVARLGKGAVAPIVHSQANQARVRLDFEVGGQRYAAVRVVRRTKAGATVAEARLERDGQPLAGSARELTTQVEQLLGLNVEQFNRTVVLPQGRFADFLHDSPAGRQQLLRQLLDLGRFDRVRQAANDRSRELTGQVHRLDALIADRSDLSEATLAELDRRQETMERLRSRVTEVLTRWDEIAVRLRSLDEELGELDRRAGLLAALEVPAGLTEADAARVEAESQVAQAHAEVETADEAVLAATAARDAGPDPTWVAQIQQAHQRRDDLRSRLQQEAERCEALRSTSAAAVAARAELEPTRVAAQAALDVARSLAGASALVAQLAIGEPCPVCRQTVRDLPDHDPDAELAAAERTAAELEAQVEARNRAVTDAEIALAKTEATVEHLQEDLQRVEDDLADAPDPDTLTQLAAQAAALDQAVEVAQQQLTAAKKSLETVQGRLTRAATALAKFDEGYRSARASVDGLGAPLPTGDLGADWQALVDWATAQLGELRGRRTEVAAAQAEAQRQRAEINAEVAQMSDEAGVAVDVTDPLGPTHQLDAQIAEIAARRDALRAQLDELTGWRADRERLAAQAEVARQLALLLQADRFEAWLLSGVLEQLTLAASQRLAELSRGRYELTAESGQLEVIDQFNAGARRGVRTLSGGETFLASLALALALAEDVAAGGGGPHRLDSVLLDEGFGTLDPEALDVVAGVIEELGAAGRMVGIITHIRELADRVPLRFEVIPAAGTSTIRRVES